ncbi:MAG: gamma-glutamyltransferase [Firmicutes bacterium]|nr:gamma-glutamyltransferase [Bacillota bacterium]
MKIKKKNIQIVIIILLFIVILAVLYKELPLINNAKVPDVEKPIDIGEVSTMGYGVVADDSRAVEIGMDILQKGGSAVDAAIAVSYALSVVSPYASGVGGSGIMLVYPGDLSEPVVYDYMGMAPKNLSSTIAIPGFVKGLEAAHDDYGILEMGELIDPSIELAKGGIKVSSLLNTLIRTSGFRIDSKLWSQFFQGSTPIAVGEIMKQPALAESLERIKINGSDDFYSGEIAKDIVKNSSLTLNDLASYKVIKNAPVLGSFAGYDVYSPTPSSGGVTLIQTLLLAEKLNLNNYNENSAKYINLLSRITQVTYHDRLTNIYDPNFHQVDTEKITSDEYIDQLASLVMSNQDLINLIVDDSLADSKDEENTTHIVVVDKSGMMVSVTNTLSQFFGSGRSAGGFFLNSHMDNFSTTPTSLNAAETGKRPRSYIAPTILAKDGVPVLGIGSPGGKRIPLMITQVLVRSLKNNETLQSAIKAKRYFYYNELLYLESNYLSTAEKDTLRNIGYSVVLYSNPQFYGSVNALYIDYENNQIIGGADNRRSAYWTWE